MVDKNESIIGPARFSVFPVGRMLPDFHWTAWAAAWLGIFKGLLWLFLDPNIPQAALGPILLKQVLLMVPFVLLSLGIWNRRRWAVWGLVILAAVDLAVFFIIPGATAALTRDMFPLYAVILMLFVGPGADVLILAAAGTLFSSTADAHRHQPNKGGTP